MVGKRAVKSGFDIEFNAARLPTLQIWGEKKVAKIPEQSLVVAPVASIKIPENLWFSTYQYHFQSGCPLVVAPFSGNKLNFLFTYVFLKNLG